MFEPYFSEWLVQKFFSGWGLLLVVIAVVFIAGLTAMPPSDCCTP